MTTTERTPLTPRQQDVLEYIEGFIDARGYPPTIREIGTQYGWTINGVANHLKALQRKGWIVREKGLSRSIGIVKESP